MKIKCLLVEDEPIAQKGLVEFIGTIAHLELKAVADDALDALKVLQGSAIDLMFLDIQMPRLNGLDFLKTLSKPPLVILTTAYPEFALRAFEYNVLDYLVKPIAFDRFVKAVNNATQQLALLQQSPGEPEYFFVKANKKLEKIVINNILFVEALAHYVVLHTTEKKLIVYLSLKSLQDKLPARFIQIHKSYLVNFDKIEALDTETVSINKQTLPIGKNYKAQLLMALQSKMLKRE
jgi:DNA-binding LytR/AlgR family response regulator